MGDEGGKVATGRKVVLDRVWRRFGTAALSVATKTSRRHGENVPRRQSEMAISHGCELFVNPLKVVESSPHGAVGSIGADLKAYFVVDVLLHGQSPGYDTGIFNGDYDHILRLDARHGSHSCA